ncbi:MAG: TIGR00266 family protein [Candidatus Schekmanbacteria bacterium]|nr:TIGR00266 family protein [Candidatus Schekmanbacteria bacterium]
MRYEIVKPGAYPVLEVTLAAQERLVAEAGAMSWMSPGMKMETSMRGGVVSSLKRKALGGESLFQNTFSTTGGAATVGLVPGQPGEVVVLELTGRDLFLERGAYIASTPEVQLDAKFQGLKGLFSEGLFVLRAFGKGLLFFAAYGSVDEIDVDGEYIVDNGYAVAWESSLSYSVTRARKIRSFLFGDQLLLVFRGRGKVWAQCRSAVSFANWVHPFRPVKSKS